MNDTISAVQKTLVALDREDLEVFIIRECIADKSLADRFVALGAGVVFEAKASDYSARIRELIDEYGGRKGFISYNASFDFSREAMRILDEAEDAAAEGKWDVAFAVLRGVSGMAVELADSSERQGRVFAVLDRIEPDSGSDWHAKYIRDKARSYRMDLMSRCGSPEEQRAYMYANVDNSEFREKLLRMAWEEGDFDEVLRLALQGEKADREFAGLVTDWKVWEMKVYRRKNDVTGILRTARYFFLHGARWDDREHSFEAMYSLMKANVPENEWIAWRDSLASDAEKSKLYMQLRYVFTEEAMWDRYMEYLRKHPDDGAEIENAPEALRMLYGEELAGMYAGCVRRCLQFASNRDAYRRVAYKLRKLVEYGGREDALAIIEEQKNRRPRRPALIDELAKVE